MASNDIGWDSVVMDRESHDLRLSVTIRNFEDYVCQPDEALKNPAMECAQRCGTKWQLIIYTNGRDASSKDHIFVYLKLVEKPPHVSVVSASYELYVLGSNGWKMMIRDRCRKGEKDLKCGHPSYIQRKKIEDVKLIYLPNGHLTIRCEGKEFLETPSPNQTLMIADIPGVVSSNQNPDFLKKMYLESINCDVILKTGLMEFKCHKCVLATNSSYFKVMFRNDLKGNRENVVDLSNHLREEELRILLEFIYLGSDKLPSLRTASLQNLFRVSVMYEMAGLQEVCESLLIGRLNLNNVMECLAFSMNFGAKRLRKAAALFIANITD